MIKLSYPFQSPSTDSFFSNMSSVKAGYYDQYDLLLGEI